MFNSLSEKLESAFKHLKGQARINELNVANTLKDIRKALLDADVNFKIAKEFTDSIKEKAIGAKVINSDLLDDVYGKQNEDDLNNWIKSIISDYENIYIPLGIHHPDHVLLSETLFSLLKDYNKTYFIYAELPYRLAYPELYKQRLDKFKSFHSLQNVSVNFTKHKVDAIHTYNSQITLASNRSYIDEDLIGKLITEEKLWRVLN